MSATPLFMMDLIIGANQNIESKKIIKDLNKIAEKLGVEINLKKY